MKNQFELSIPKPCREKWDTFPPTTQGGYCSNCQKDVIDFTKWSDQQIKDFFKKNKSKTCGRFRKSQLKMYSLDDTPTQRFRFAPLSLLGITLLLAQSQVHAQQARTPQTEVTSPNSLHNVPAHVQPEKPGKRIVTGVVKYAEDGTPIPGTNVVLKRDDKIGTNTDADGKFSIEIPNAKENDVLVFSFIGLLTLEQDISGDAMFVTLTPDYEALDESVIVGGCGPRRWSPRGIWIRIKGIFM